MGARLCCLRPPSQSPKHTPNRSSSSVNHVGSVSSIIDLSESPCLKKGEEEKKVISPNSLGYRLVNSPGWKESDVVGMIKHTSPPQKKKIYMPSSLSPELPNEFYTPRNSLSTPRNGFAPRGLWKIEEEEEEEKEEDGKTNFTDGRNVGTKRVRFKLPGEADIIVVYSPDKSFDE